MTPPNKGMKLTRLGGGEHRVGLGGHLKTGH
jgi:hypothetical protein